MSAIGSFADIRLASGGILVGRVQKVMVSQPRHVHLMLTVRLMPPTKSTSSHPRLLVTPMQRGYILPDLFEGASMATAPADVIEMPPLKTHLAPEPLVSTQTELIA